LKRLEKRFWISFCYGTSLGDGLALRGATVGAHGYAVSKAEKVCRQTDQEKRIGAISSAMKVNTSQNMAIVPRTMSKTYPARSYEKTLLVDQNDTKSSKNASHHKPRRLGPVIVFEKGHLVDVYI
jgi:hypothetical protein